MLDELGGATRTMLDRALRDFAPPLRVRETGTVARITGSVARVTGLPGLMSEELVSIEGGPLAIAVDLEPQDAGIVFLGDPGMTVAGTEVHATGRLADIEVGPALLGRVIDATGRPLDGRGPIRGQERRLVARDAPSIMDRAPVSAPLETGIKVIDALVPIGRGQRELILGDRQTGKTTIAVDALLNQRETGVLGVYCAIGQRGTAVARVVEALRRGGVLSQCVVVVAAGEDPPGLQYLAPYAATSIAEWFMEQGRDVLIVYDDLTRHARAYREVSLLLRRPPGREAFPGDIFYLHARLLERATRFVPERGGGSLTALPIIETQAQDIAAYIPTNLISITDGQIYLSPDLFALGQLPAVDVGRSVSRVGGDAQRPALRAVTAPLRLAHAQFEELETFARFATRLDDATRDVIARGRHVRAALRQMEHDPLTVAEQVLVLRAAATGLFDDLPLDGLADVERRLRTALQREGSVLAARLAAAEPLTESDWEALSAFTKSVLARRGNDD